MHGRRQKRRTRLNNRRRKAIKQTQHSSFFNNILGQILEEVFGKSYINQLAQLDHVKGANHTTAGKESLNTCENHSVGEIITSKAGKISMVYEDISDDEWDADWWKHLDMSDGNVGSLKGCSVLATFDLEMLPKNENGDLILNLKNKK